MEAPLLLLELIDQPLCLAAGCRCACIDANARHKRRRPRCANTLTVWPS